MRALVTSAAGIERDRAIEVSSGRPFSINTSSDFGGSVGILASPIPLIQPGYARRRLATDALANADSVALRLQSALPVYFAA